jgi:hypothetical protein
MPQKCCVEAGCNKIAIGRTEKCKAHGGGARCIEPGCNKSAIGGYDKCITHGGVHVVLNLGVIRVREVGITNV